MMTIDITFADIKPSTSVLAASRLKDDGQATHTSDRIGRQGTLLSLSLGPVVITDIFN